MMLMPVAFAAQFRPRAAGVLRVFGVRVQDGFEILKASAQADGFA